MISEVSLFKNFRVNILIRFGVIIILVILLSVIALKTDLWTLILWISVAIFFLILEFLRYVEKFKNQFVYFLQSINQEDFSVSFPASRLSKKDEQFSGILNDISSKIRKLRAEKETGYQYLKMIIDHINVGIISYNQEGKITLMNRSAAQILQKPHVRKIRTLEKIDRDFYREIMNLSSENKSLVKLIRGNRLWHLSLQATEIKLEEGYEKVIVMQDIKSELDEKEIDSWQKLVRVINHEIMNSVIPISTLASVLDQLMSDWDTREKMDDIVKDVAEGVKTIEQRSKGLANFVKATKNLTQISKPVFKTFNIEVLFNRVDQLLSSDLKKNGVDLVLKKPEEKIMLKADFELIEQVLINLVKNAKEAYEMIEPKKKIISIETETIDKQVFIYIRDDGPGIEKDMMDQIFIPFYTTKKEGSGIGLPLSRQIIRLHKGKLEVKSNPGDGTTFIIIL